MRKVKLQMQMSIDGFVAGPNGELDWMLFNWDDVLINYVTGLTDSSDTIVMGRKLAEGFIPYWKNVADNPADEQYEFGKKMTEKPRIVFSKTLQESQWHNAAIAKDSLHDEIKKLKEQPGGDIIVYGGATLVSGLLSSDLIDEYHFFVNPVVLGSGMSIFGSVEEKKKLKHIKTTTSGSGIVVLCYEPEK
jgi:dihydrofolate reductase